MILVDTSVWIDHFRSANEMLARAAVKANAGLYSSVQ